MATSALTASRISPKHLTPRQERMVAARRAKPKATSQPQTTQELQRFKEARAARASKLANSSQEITPQGSPLLGSGAPPTLSGYDRSTSASGCESVTPSRPRSRSRSCSPAFQATTTTRRRLSVLGSASEDTDILCDNLDDIVSELTAEPTATALCPSISVESELSCVPSIAPRSAPLSERTRARRSSSPGRVGSALSQLVSGSSGMGEKTTMTSLQEILASPALSPLKESKKEESIEVVDSYRPNVVAIVVNREGKVLCGERSDFQEESYWQCPQGGIDPGEDVLEAARREVKEELGLDPSLLKVLPNTYQCKERFRYEFTKPVKKDGRYYKGQEQQVVIFMLDGGIGDCDLDSCETREFKRLEWKDLGELVPTVLPSKKQVYETFTNLLPPTLKACATEALWELVGLSPCPL